MEILMGVLIGFILSEFICFLITLFTDSEEKGVIGGSFVFFVLFMGIKNIFRKVRIRYIRTFYVPFALCGYFHWNDDKSNKEIVLRIFRVKPKNIRMYRDKFEPFIDENSERIVYYYFKQIDGKYTENVMSVGDKRNKDDIFSYDWIQENMLRV